MAGAHANFTFAAATGANDDAAAFTTDKEKAFATHNVPALDSVSVSAIDAGATLGHRRRRDPRPGDGQR